MKFINWIAGSTVERICMIFSVTWGAWLLWFQPLKFIPGLRFLVAVMDFSPITPDTIWGLAFLLLGLSRIYLVHKGGHFMARARLSMAASSAYLTVTILITMGSYSSTGIPCYATIAWANLIAYVQLREQHAITEQPPTSVLP